MPFRTKLTDFLEIEHPILLAPMGGVAGGALAAAVSNAGGLGLIGLGYGDPDWLEREFAAAGNAPVGCGFITWSLARRPQLLPQALAHRPKAVMLSFGDVRPFAGAIKEAGAKLICQVQSVAQAVEALQCGADIVVAQGTEAGGHGSARATLPLVPAVVDAVAETRPGTPVLAAGGIADGRGLAAALVLGADGALIGTRFYAAEESLGTPEAKRRILDARGDATVRTRIFDIARDLDWPPVFTGRALVNHFAERWHGKEAELEREAATERARYKQAAETRDYDTAVIFAGENVDLIRDCPPAARLVERLIAEAESALARPVRS
jgi:nitronate monooxygenase